MEELLGLYEKDLNWYQMSMRAVVVFIFATFCIWFAGMRTFRKRSSVDLVTTLILGAILSKAIIGEEPFIPILVASFAFVLMLKLSHYLMFFYRSRHKDSRFPLILVRDGVIQEENLRNVRLTRDDLERALRAQESTEDLNKVRKLCLESDGRLSIICN